MKQARRRRAISIVTISIGFLLLVMSQLGLVTEWAPIQQKETIWNANAPMVDVNKKCASQTERLQRKNTRKNVVLFICNEAYAIPTVTSIENLRKDGGFHGDVAVLLDTNDGQNKNFTKEIMQEQLMDHSNVHLFTDSELWDSLFSGLESKEQLDYLQSVPSHASCIPDRRKAGFRAYYLKTLMFHPLIAERWDTILFLDSCMTFHNAHVDVFFDLPELNSGNILARPDPWMFEYTGFEYHMNECTREQYIPTVEHLSRTTIEHTTYFNSALVLFDSSVIRDYHGSIGSASATLLEILELYHFLSKAFDGNQLILSLYWIYKRNHFQILPERILGSPLIPYDFIVRVPDMPYVITNGNDQLERCGKRFAQWHTNRLNSNVKKYNPSLKLKIEE